MITYAITGHTNGIGKTIYHRLSPNIIGFSLSSGYDINNRKDRNKIIEESSACDIFINNAAAGLGQTLLFLELFNVWKDTDKTIINVGSSIAEIKILPNNLQHLAKYRSEKIFLKKMSSRAKGNCTVKYKWFGYVGTDEILKKYPHFILSDYITKDQAADIILS